MCKGEPEEEESKGQEKYFNKVNESFPKWSFDSKSHNQESQRTPRWVNIKKKKIEQQEPN